MSTDLAVYDASEPLLAPVPSRSDSDETTIALWLHGRSAGTRRAYEGDARAFCTERRPFFSAA